VVVNHRWGWAPGRREHRSVWSPALVGWVGGAGWSAGFKLNNRHQALPARGWYPLSPRDRFVPTYRLSDERLRRLNNDVRTDSRHRGDDHHRAGLTVVPQDQFGQHGQVSVSKLLRASVPVQVRNTAPSAAPPAPPAARERDWRREQRRGDDRTDRADRGAQWRDRVGERDPGERHGDDRSREQALRAPVLPPQPQPARPVVPEHRQPAQAVTAMSAQPAQPQVPQPVAPEHHAPPQPATVLSAPPAQPAQQPLPPQRLPWRMEHRERGDDDRGRSRQLSTVPGPVPAGAAAAPLQTAPAPAPAERFERPHRAEGDFERRRGMVQPAPAPAPLYVAPPSAPVPVHMPPPAQAVARPAPPPAAAPAPAQEAAHGRGRRGDDSNPRQHER
jgi:hypothetical protein